MVNPTGYTALDFIGFTDKGPYAANVNYVKNDLVHYGGNIWRILIDDTIGITPAEGPNYTIFIGEPTNLIERIIAPLEDNPATVAYQTGRQIIYNDHLYEVIQNIAVGDILIAYEDDPTNANIKLASPVETQVLALNASKVNKSDIANNVTTTTAGKVLDARQGKVLQDGINTKVNTSDVVNNVTTTTAGKVLDARQGKVLQDGINTKVNTSDVVNNVTTTTAGKVLDARQGKALQDGINTKVNKSDIANNVTTTAEGKVLDARQGKALQDDIDDLQSGKADNSVIAPVESGTTASRAYAAGAHFIRDSAFCTAKTAIAQGEAFTLNTNYTAGTVGETINVSKSSVNVPIISSLFSGGHIHYDRYGDVITISIDGLTASAAISGTTTIINNIPGAKNTDLAVTLIGRNNHKPYRCRLSIDGFIRTWYDPIPSGEVLEGLITYITA